VIRLTHGRVSLALHELRAAPGPPLLCLHAVGGSAADFADVVWPGRVFALDFTGHGASDRLRGGAYYPETIAGDADAALAHIGGAYLAGAGAGAYVALLLAGARRDVVPAALLLPGAGLEGGGALPDWTKSGFTEWRRVEPPLPGCDPAVHRLERDVRPPDYAEAFALAARRLLFAAADPAPPWWQAARATPAAQPAPADRARAFALLAEQPA
jgi:pimeloyl-ACP methyl ester carboxylesterase